MIRTHITEMKIAPRKPKEKPNRRSLPPKRGQIKIEMFKLLLKSAVTVVAKLAELGRKIGENGGCLSSATAKPDTPSRYYSDGDVMCDLSELGLIVIVGEAEHLKICNLRFR